MTATVFKKKKKEIVNTWCISCPWIFVKCLFSKIFYFVFFICSAAV